MAGSGPPPNPNSRRQMGNQAHTWTDLPADGYQGEVPAWPFETVTDAEAEMWARYWRKPQAAAWAAMGMTDEVALYVRSFLEGAGGSIKAVTEARQWTTPLGLTPSAMLKNRWRIRADDVAEKRGSKPVEASPRKRLKVVADDAVAGS